MNVQVEPLGLAEWAAFQDALRTLHGLDVRNLGLVGTQRMLAVGVRSCGLDFVRCALNRVSWASAAESWEVRTVGARSYVSFGSDSRVPPKFVETLFCTTHLYLRSRACCFHC